VIGNLLAKVMGGGASELPREWLARRTELATRRAKATAIAEKERSEAQAHVVAAAERARRADAEIDDAERAAVSALEDELGVMLYGPDSKLRSSVASWLDEPTRANARRVIDALRALEAHSRDVLNASLDPAALSIAWMANLIDSGREDLIAKFGSALGWSYGDAWLSTGAAVVSAALAGGEPNVPEVEARLMKAERAFAETLRFRHGTPTDTARLFWACRLESGTQRSADARFAARKPAHKPADLSYPLPEIQHDPKPVRV
jgi:hypothetical protein